MAHKFINETSFRCGHCQTRLRVVDITVNPNHFFNPGQLYKCTCGKSQVWANSVRYPESLINYCDGKAFPHPHDPEAWGFCNDRFCPICWGYFGPVSTGGVILESENRYVDVYGCMQDCCPENKQCLWVGGGGGELDGQKALARWYKSHQNMWRHLVETGNKQ